MPVTDIDSFFLQQLNQYLLSDRSEIPRDDSVIILWLSPEILQMCPDQIHRRRCHGGTHILCIADSIIHDFACCHSGNLHL